MQFKESWFLFITYLWRPPYNPDVVPGVVVEPDGVGLDLRVQLAGPQLHGQRHPSVLQRDVQVVVFVS